MVLRSYQWLEHAGTALEADREYTDARIARSRFQYLKLWHLVRKDGAVDRSMVDGSFAKLDSYIRISMVEVDQQLVDPAVASHDDSA